MKHLCMKLTPRSLLLFDFGKEKLLCIVQILNPLFRKYLTYLMGS